ncbi:serine/threonine-protein kinase [Uniformispora flossi]|uniref:serine/threonine-protein kinase n=1 Tax=Uniformispora flossi TaxID=3390723 RepID=UPI003C2CF874
MTEGSGESRLVSGRYRLGEALGRGGMGTVWRAVDELLRREVAVKEVRIPDDLDASEQEVRRERAMREARAAARVTHPNVVTIYDVVEDDGRPWIVMELVRARSLDEVIEHEGRLGPSEAAEVGLKVLAALRAARAADVLHRDVKPSNILLGADGRVILTDFGIATVLGSATLTATGMLIGSPEYLAPERVLGRRPGPASDLWSLGVTLYQAMEGRSPFQRTSAIETLTAVLQDEAAAPRYAGALGPALDALLRKDPDERPDEDAVEGLLTAALKGKSEHGTGAVAGAAAVAAGATAGATAVPPPIPAPPRPSDAFASAATVEDPHGPLGATLGPGPGARSGPGSGSGSGPGSGSGRGAAVLGGAGVGAAAGAAAVGGTAYPPDGWPTGQQAPAGGHGGSDAWPTAAHGQAADSGPGGVGHPRSGDTPQPFPIGGFHGTTRPIEEDGRPGGAYPQRRRPRGAYAVLAGVAAALVAAAFWIVPSALGSNDKGGDGRPGMGPSAGAGTVSSPAAPSDNAVAGGVTVTPTTEQATYEPTGGQADSDYTEPTKSAPKTTKPKPTTSRPTTSTTWPTTSKSPTTTPTGSTTSAGSGSSSGSGGATKSGAGSGSTAGAGAGTKADATG